MRRSAALLALVLSPALALADTPPAGEMVPSLGTPISAEEFEAHVVGKTVTYHQHGLLFGIEEYLPDRKVRWSVTADTCQYGVWYPSGQDICFVYEDDPKPACWTFWLNDGALVALSTEAAPGQELYETSADTTPLPCPGPDVGV
ncbi:MAG: hypothetical protein ACK4IU_07705 [Tabrizicola flagellatus]|uniref:hypothetical protein n=1 Tax=Tabrizicola flagellatus TaxID=2593021 RepID=UPI003918DBE7